MLLEAVSAGTPNQPTSRAARLGVNTPRRTGYVSTRSVRVLAASQWHGMDFHVSASASCVVTRRRVPVPPPEWMHQICDGRYVLLIPSVGSNHDSLDGVGKIIGQTLMESTNRAQSRSPKSNLENDLIDRFGVRSLDMGGSAILKRAQILLDGGLSAAPLGARWDSRCSEGDF